MPRSRFSLVVFDYDGTLSDSKNAIAKLLNRALEDLGHPTVPAISIHARIGLSLEHIVAELTALVPGSEAFDGVISQFRDLAVNGGMLGVELFDGIAELIARLHAGGTELAIATGMRRRGLEKSLRDAGLESYFACFATADMVECQKPAPDMLHLILENCGRSADEALIIGDTIFDIGMGKAAGVRTCAVSYGSHDRDLLASAEPDYLVADVAELAELLFSSELR